MTSSLEELKRLYEGQQKQLLADYREILRIPSVSTDPAYKEGVLQACKWVKEYLDESGLDVEVWETPIYPVVYASYMKAGPDKPTVLIYNHYDVQPVDPLDLWKSPPFEPTIRDGEIYARGAQDNKGQMMYTLCAIRALLKESGELPVNIKLIVEGEEECKSIGLSKILESRREQLQADYLLVVDLDVPNLTTPAINLGVRGMAAFTVELTGSNSDLHSGMVGGCVYNPNHALVEMLAKLRSPDGRVTLPGFYDDIEPLTSEERELLSIEIDPSVYEEFEAMPSGGEQRFSPGERVRLQPTLEINGLYGGYSGAGMKTVIPAKAGAKLSCRLVPGQDPDKIFGSFQRFFEEQAPPGIRVNLISHGGAQAMRSSPKSLLAATLAEAFGDVFGNPCQYTLSGGSIPIAAELASVGGASPAFIGLGLSGDRVHAPNEHFGINRMEMGFLIIAHFLQLLGKK